MSQGIWQPLEAENRLQLIAHKEIGTLIEGLNLKEMNSSNNLNEERNRFSPKASRK